MRRRGFIGLLAAIVTGGRWSGKRPAVAQVPESDMWAEVLKEYDATPPVYPQNRPLAWRPAGWATESSRGWKARRTWAVIPRRVGGVPRSWLMRVG